MRSDYPHIGLAALCGLFGKTRHGWYDHGWRRNRIDITEDIIVQEVLQIRASLPRLGTRKLHYMLTARLTEHGISIGRDKLFELLGRYRLLVKTRRRTVSTTQSHHWLYKYHNLTGDLQVNGPNQLWVSDITYIRLPGKFVYLSLITDAYSRKIMGYHLREDLSAQGCLSALQMALRERAPCTTPLIHHSDRGIQYCSKDYVKLLTDEKIAISMTENGDPYENALAERINGIIKTEFRLYSTTTGFEQTKALVDSSILAYNELRPHSSCDYLTPAQAHLQTGTLKKRWKKSTVASNESKMCNFKSSNPV